MSARRILILTYPFVNLVCYICSVYQNTISYEPSEIFFTILGDPTVAVVSAYPVFHLQEHLTYADHLSEPS